MRILFVSYLHPAIAPGGAQRVAYEMFEAARAGGHEAFLISALEHDHEAAYGKPGAPIVPVYGEPNQYFYFPQFYDFVHLAVRDWRTVTFFRELVERLRPDVVHFHHYHRIGMETIRAARLAAPDAFIALTLHEMMAICLADGQMVKRQSRALCSAASPLACHKCFPGYRPEFIALRAARLQAMLAECDAFVFPSEFIADRYVAWGLPAHKCAVIPNGQVNPAPDFDRTRHDPAVNRFGFFGQFLDNKGIDLVLEAVLLLARENRLPPRGLVLEINGANKHYATKEYLDKVTRLAREIGETGAGPIRIADNGAYERDELAHRMGAVDWVLVPSTWWEIFGLVVSEAWMFGRPVIAADIAGLKERIRPDVDGLTFRPRDARALADTMEACIGDEPRWLQLNAGIRQPWNARDMLDAHVNLWQEAR